MKTVTTCWEEPTAHGAGSLLSGEHNNDKIEGTNATNRDRADLSNRTDRMNIGLTAGIVTRSGAVDEVKTVQDLYYNGSGWQGRTNQVHGPTRAPYPRNKSRRRWFPMKCSR